MVLLATKDLLGAHHPQGAHQLCHERGVQPRRHSGIASASQDETVKVWDAATGQETRTLKGHSARVTSVAFSPTAQRLASASDDQDGEGVGRRDRTGNPHPQGAHRPGQRAWRSARRHSGSPPPSGDRTVKVWDAATGQETLTLKGHTDDVMSVAFSPDGRRLASASGG